MTNNYLTFDNHNRPVHRVTYKHEYIGKYVVQVTSLQSLDSARQASERLNKMVDIRENIKDRFKVVLIDDKENGYCVIRKLIPDDPEDFIDRELLKACEPK